MNPQDAYDRLVQGNLRFTEGHIARTSRHAVRRMELQEKQRPFAVIVGCSDSRVPPEMIFDQGLGDLFVVRVAGQVVGPLELDSIEYGVKYLYQSQEIISYLNSVRAADKSLKIEGASIEKYNPFLFKRFSAL
jgi:carbonic anhydrase